jgi:hypothetical protein
MTTNILLKTNLEACCQNKTKKVNPRTFANRRSLPTLRANPFFKSLEHLFTAVLHALPQGNLIIEDLVIKGDKLEVRYKSPDSPVPDLADNAVAVRGLKILNLIDGRVIEHDNLVYQVRIS